MASSSAAVPPCSVCLSAPMVFVCSACEDARYCSLVCSKADKSRHKHERHDADLIVLPKQHVRQGDLYIGALVALQNQSLMNRVQAVLSVINLPTDVVASYIPPGMDRMHVQLPDEVDSPIEEYWDEMAAFINKHIENGHNVLVHCHAGMSRSVTAVLYYLIRYRGFKTAKGALKVVRRSRPMARPNSGFWKKLKNV